MICSAPILVFVKKIFRRLYNDLIGFHCFVKKAIKLHIRM